MNNGLKFYDYSELDQSIIDAYQETVRSGFPPVIFESKVVQTCWPIIESYFPEYQQFLINEERALIGFINAIPFFWDQPLMDLPDEGWDWLVDRGISGYENKVEPNCIGGLQIVVSKSFLGKGYSKILINRGKEMLASKQFKHFIIPIRPAYKSKFPNMEMEAYIQLKEDDKIYDPWLRVHTKSGASYIKVCHNAMNIQGDMSIWERLLGHKITKSGLYYVDGGLNPVAIKLENNIGEYREDNIWIYYGDENP